MTDLPEKDEIVERAHHAADFAIRDGAPTEPEIVAALDALTVPDLLGLLRERGCEIDFFARVVDGRARLTVVLPEEKPDALRNL